MDEKETEKAFADLRELEDRRDALRKLAQAADEQPEDPYAGEQRSGNLFDIAF